jgi:transcriptional regulator with XRE-family HTH domain
MDWYEMSNPGVILTIGKRIKEIRLRKNITQEDLAKRAGVGVVSVINIEKGKPVSMSIFIPIIRELNLLENLERLLPSPPISPILMKKMQGKKRKRAS